MQEINALVLFHRRVPDKILTGISAGLGEYGIDAQAEDEGNEGGPVYILLTISVAAMPFFNAFMTKAGEDAWATFKKMFFLAAGDGAGRQSQPGIMLEDNQTQIKIKITGDIPESAFLNLVYILEGSGGVHRGIHTLEWSQRWQRWITHTFALGHEIVRRVPPRPSRHGERGNTPTLADVPQNEIAWIRDRAYRARSVISRQRAHILDSRIEGSDPESIAGFLVLSTELVEAVIHDFNRSGRDAVKPEYNGVTPVIVDDDIAEEIIFVAQEKPSVYRSRARQWTIPRLSEILVREGVIEDINHPSLYSFLASNDLHIPLA
ncbi:hypothetical protein ACFOY4_21180 [Actinomadura syzygii]|uniref:Uncharacterized protein n=1 Tax=Actinomadura syzygii TaxID=1427538 RepID=A0A5D0TS43_9ACTN|nr:hypothetical protein [Actinomadura syzygii]TYC08240.1 hypothetical protein FXF65_38695 [Actinomadura syzygii]